MSRYQRIEEDIAKQKNGQNDWAESGRDLA